MVRSFELLSAIAAIVAAAFWFLSATRKLPTILPYWDKTPENDPFFMAIKHSATMNRWAAGFSGVSALCMAVSLFAK